MKGPVTQSWIHELPFMQQTVLLTAIRGPDGIAKYHFSKFLLRWYRRCILLSALDGRALTTPHEQGGGSFTGPSTMDPDSGSTWQTEMESIVNDYLRCVDELPHHFQLHFMHAAEILGYKHPDAEIRAWWHTTYLRLVHDMHLWPETEAQLDERLGDSREGWAARADTATMS